MDLLTCEKIYDFWFGVIAPTQEYIEERLGLWFFQDPEKDDEARKLFMNIPEPVVPAQIENPKVFLSYILYFDQMPRNIYRGSPKAWEKDFVALELSLKGLELQLDRELNIIERFFFYLPLQHSEVLEYQMLSVEKIKELCRVCPRAWNKFFGFAEDFAIRHEIAIRRFGRFPHRNQILGRVSHKEELEFLNDPKNNF